MRGYSKIKEGNLFSQRSKSKKDFPFIDKDFDDIYSSNSTTKTHLENEQKPNISNNIDEEKPKKNNEFFLGKKKSDGYVDHDKQNHDDDEEKQQQQVNNNNNNNNNGAEKKKIGSVLKRNLTISSSTTTPFAYQKSINKSNNNISNNNNKLERQSSTRAIQGVVKRAFSMRRSSSVNSERYCRIYDQSFHVQDFDNYDYIYDDCHNDNINHQDDEFERSGSMMDSTRSMSINNNNKINNNNGKMHVGSKFSRACKRLFSR